MKITPLDIQQQQFKKKGGRYECGEVDAFLEIVRMEMEEVTRITSAQADEIKRLQGELSELRSLERILKEAIISTQKASEDIKAQAKKQAEVIVAEARLQAEKILDQADHQLQKVKSDIMEAKRQRIQWETQVRALLEAHTRLLEACTADRKTDEAVLDNLAIIKKR